MNDDTFYKTGSIIMVKAFPNKVLTRRVVGTLNGVTVFVCNENEFSEALKEGRKAVSIGFPISDVIMITK